MVNRKNPNKVVQCREDGNCPVVRQYCQLMTTLILRIFVMYAICIYSQSYTKMLLSFDEVSEKTSQIS